MLPLATAVRYGRTMKKRFVRILIGLVIIAVVVGAAAIFFLGAIVKAGVEKVGPRVAKVPVKLDGATISLFNGHGKLKGFVVGNPEGYKSSEAIKVDSVAVDLVPRSVLADKVVIRSIKIVAPEITYETDLKGSNLQKILDNVGGSAAQDEQAPTKEQQTTKTKLQVDELLITGGKVHVAAALVGSATVPLPEIHLKDLGQGPDGITPAELSKKVLNAVLDATTKAVMANASNLPDAGKALGTGAVDQLKKAGSGVSDLFKKK
jgi:uncharacterized protein involved in outer membrane biogenesis